MSIYTPPTYLFVLYDTLGVVLANNFISIFNPVGSGRAFTGLQLIVSSYSPGNTAVAKSLLTKRITAASGGTLVSASTIPRFRTDFPDPVTQIRTGNPTVTTTGLVLSAISPVISLGAGESGNTLAPPPGASFIHKPGEGAVIYTEAGDIDQMWNITIVWTETSV